MRAYSVIIQDAKNTFRFLGQLIQSYGPGLGNSAVLCTARPYAETLQVVMIFISSCVYSTVVQSDIIELHIHEDATTIFFWIQIRAIGPQVDLFGTGKIILM